MFSDGHTADCLQGWGCLRGWYIHCLGERSGFCNSNSEVFLHSGNKQRHYEKETRCKQQNSQQKNIKSNKVSNRIMPEFERPYLTISNGSSVVFSDTDRWEIYTSNWFWYFSKIDITMATTNKKTRNQYTVIFFFFFFCVQDLNWNNTKILNYGIRQTKYTQMFEFE